MVKFQKKKNTIFIVCIFFILMMLIFLFKWPQNIEVFQWSTRSAINGDLTHSFIEVPHAQEAHTIERLIFQASKQTHAGYLFVQDGELRLRSNVDSLEWSVQNNSLKSRPISSYRKFEHRSDVFSFDYKDYFLGLTKNNKLKGKFYFTRGVFPYCYASSKGVVIVCSNWGDIILYKDGIWKLMDLKGDINDKHSPCVFQVNERETLCSTPRGIQFYSSVVFEGQTLLGEFPTGRIYAFDGSTLKLWEHQPWEALKEDPNDWRHYGSFELQSLTVFCGDLYAGFWPKGEIWRFSAKTKKWHFVASLFTPYDIQPFRNKKIFDIPSEVFLRQRICSMVPYHDGLYVSTGNYNSWPSDFKIEGMSQDIMNEYGAVYKIQRNDCLAETSSSLLKNFYLLLSRMLYNFFNK